MSGRLQGKVCIVTGAGQGVGRGIALAFAREGATVAVVEFNEQSGQQVAAEVEGLGSKSLFVHCDVADRASVDAAVAAVVETFGGIDVLVNNAQRAPAGPTPLVEHTDEIVDLCFSTGFRGTLYFMQACYPHLKERTGKIVNFASAAGLEGQQGMAAYGASKEAIRALSKTAAREWGPDGINVNIVCPLAKSPGVVKLLEIAPEMERRMTKGNPIARIGDCEEDIAPVVVFLAGDESRYVTGQTLCADGGAFLIR
jgi:NAD(P)-dependent dehydrogenase (short-subunit alcohol dehydrogenase family)